MTLQYHEKELSEVTRQFMDLAELGGFEVLHSAADRHGVYEWACGRAAENDSSNDTYVMLACLPQSDDGWVVRLELSVVAERLPSTIRQVAAACHQTTIEEAPTWLDEHWPLASFMAEHLQPSEAFDGTVPF